jgi:hypothetical protein
MAASAEKGLARPTRRSALNRSAAALEVAAGGSDVVVAQRRLDLGQARAAGFPTMERGAKVAVDGADARPDTSSGLHLDAGVFLR